MNKKKILNVKTIKLIRYYCLIRSNVAVFVIPAGIATSTAVAVAADLA
jgi:hypothetical protein